jgi:hypothetical protein
MRSTAILALLMSVAVCRPAAAPPADCRSSGTADATADRPLGQACRDPSLGGRITQRGPGFWALDDAATEPGRDPADPQPTVLGGAGPISSPDGTACRRYPLPVTVAGQPMQAMIVACPRADGGWQVTQYTPGLPPQVYIGPAPPEPADFAGNDYGYPESYPDWADWPSLSGFAPANIGGRRFHDFRQPFDHRSTDDFSHRSGRELRHGAAHSFSQGAAHGFGHGAGVAGAAGMHR